MIFYAHCTLLLLLYSVLAKDGKGKGNVVVELRNTDFTQGTYEIKTSGTYRIMEDISFDPNAPLNGAGATAAEVSACCFPTATFTAGLTDEENAAAYELGFFAAISVQADDVIIDLNGHRIEQSARSALMQRFFAIIELADQPFIENTGPANFGDEIVGAKRVHIKNGVLGRSSHHGIHGNDNEDIQLSNIRFDGYEVAAAHFNAVEGLRVTDCVAINRKDVPVLGTFSALRFIKRYVQYLVDEASNVTLKVNGADLGATYILDAIETAEKNVHDDVMYGNGYINSTTHPEEYGLFHNKFGVVDGNAYGFVTHKRGPAVNGFSTIDASVWTKRQEVSSDIHFTDVEVRDHAAFVNEIVALKLEGAAVNDPNGALFQLHNVHPETQNPLTVESLLDPSKLKYTGNVLANAQAFVGKAQLNGAFVGSGLDVTRNKVNNQQLIEWIESNAAWDVNINGLMEYLCNGDSMFHVDKGVISFRMDGADRIDLKRCRVTNVTNLGASASTVCGNYANGHSHPAATLLGYGGGDVRGFSFAGSTKAHVEDSSVIGAHADNGEAIGFDILTNSMHVHLDRCSVSGVTSGNDDTIGINLATDTEKNKVKQSCVDMPITHQLVNDGDNNISPNSLDCTGS
jgi:hypothetical protein